MLFSFELYTEEVTICDHAAKKIYYKMKKTIIAIYIDYRHSVDYRHIHRVYAIVIQPSYLAKLR